MGSKNKPGKYDCYANALPDEPMMVLLGRDVLAPGLTYIWAMIRAGNRAEASRAFHELMNGPAAVYVLNPESDKALEASDCAINMIEWRKANNGAWRKPSTESASVPTKGE